MAAAVWFSRLAGLRRNALKLGGASVQLYHHCSPNKYMEAVKNLSETTVTELSNGLRVATEFSDLPIANIGLWVEAGSRYEPSSLNGAANFFEHLVFKGSKNRPRRDLETEITRLGAELHASTGREETVFYAKCLPSDITTCVDILTDAVRNPGIDAADVEEQRKVILSELETFATDPRQVTFDYLHLTAYQGTQLENSVFGPSENIERMTGDDVRSYVNTNFTAPRMVLVGTGNVKHDEIVRLAEKHLSGDLVLSGSTSMSAKTCRFTGSDVRYRDDWMPFAHAAIAVDTCGYTNPDIYPLMLAKTHISNWDKTAGCSTNTSNRLVEHIYKGKGCHSFDSFHLLYRDTGLWGCYFVMDGMSLDDFVYNLQDEWMRLCVAITDADLLRAKARLRNEMSFCLADGSRSLIDVGREVHCFNGRISMAEAVHKLESVTLNQLKDVCSKYIYDRCPAVASVGPVEAMPDYNRVRSGMYWLRY